MYVQGDHQAETSCGAYISLKLENGRKEPMMGRDGVPLKAERGIGEVLDVLLLHLVGSFCFVSYTEPSP